MGAFVRKALCRNRRNPRLNQIKSSYFIDGELRHARCGCSQRTAWHRSRRKEREQGTRGHNWQSESQSRCEQGSDSHRRPAGDEQHFGRGDEEPAGESRWRTDSSPQHLDPQSARAFGKRIGRDFGSVELAVGQKDLPQMKYPDSSGRIKDCVVRLVGLTLCAAVVLPYFAVAPLRADTIVRSQELSRSSLTSVDGKRQISSGPYVPPALRTD